MTPSMLAQRGEGEVYMSHSLNCLLCSVDKNRYCTPQTLVFCTLEKRFKEQLLRTCDEKADDCLLRQERGRGVQCDGFAKFSLNLTVHRPT
jgi:hypothetical protein